MAYFLVVSKTTSSSFISIWVMSEYYSVHTLRLHIIKLAKFVVSSTYIGFSVEHNVRVLGSSKERI